MFAGESQGPDIEWGEAARRAREEEKGVQAIQDAPFEGLVWYECLSIAGSASAEPATLERLSRHYDWRVCEAVARNPRTAIEALQALTGHPNHFVQQAAQETLSLRG